MIILNKIYPAFDLSGHFYLQYENKIYEFSIDNKDNLEIFQVFDNDTYHYEIIDYDNFNEDFLDISELKLLSKSTTLKSKIIREFIKENDNAFEENKNNEDNDCEIDDDTINEINKNMQYYPEDLELEYESNNYDIDHDDNELRFIYYGDSTIVKLLNEIDNTEITEQNANYINDDSTKDLASYDTYLYSGDSDHSHLIFVSKLNYINSSYRIFISEDGSIVLKIVAANRVNYKLKITENKLILDKII